MEDERGIDNKFSWSGLFLVTACCCFLFSFALKVLEGQFSTWLLLIGAGTGVLGVINWCITVIDRHYAKKRKSKRFASSDF